MTTHRHDHVTWQATARRVQRSQARHATGYSNRKRGRNNITWRQLQSGEITVVYVYNKQEFDV